MQRARVCGGEGGYAAESAVCGSERGMRLRERVCGGECGSSIRNGCGVITQDAAGSINLAVVR